MESTTTAGFEGLEYPDWVTEQAIEERFKHGLYDNPLQCFTTARERLHRAQTFHSLDHLEDVLDKDTLLRGALLAHRKDGLGELRQVQQGTDAPVATETSAAASVQPRNTEPFTITNETAIDVFQQDEIYNHAGQSSPPRANVPAVAGQAGADAAGGGPFPPRLKYFSELEREAISKERNGSLQSLTKGLVVILATCAIGAIAQGWAQQSIVGANISWPADLKIANDDQGILRWNYFVPTASPDDPDQGLERFGSVNAISYFAAAIVGAFVSDPLTYAFGRRSALMFAGLCTLGSPIGAAYSQTWIQLFFCRFIQGVGMGAKSSVVPVLESEVLLPELRGRILVSWQTSVAFGIWLGTCANLIFHSNWRWQIGIAFLPAVPLICLCFVIPESPRWLIKKGRFRQAYKVLLEIRETPLQAARDLYLFHEQILFERHLFLRKDKKCAIQDSTRMNSVGIPYASTSSTWNYLIRVPRLFSKRRNRRAMFAAASAMIAQQFSGANVFAFLATTLFKDAGLANLKNMWFNFGFAAVNTVFSASAFLYIEQIGRRSLLLLSLIGMFPFLLLTGHVMDAPKSPQLGATIPLVLIYVAIYSPGAGVIPFLYASEVFPQDFREVGMSFACCVNFVFAGALAMAVPQFTSSPTHKYMRLLGAFAGLDGLAVLLVWAFLRGPEKATSLEHMNYLFGASSKDWLSYQISTAWRRNSTFDDWQQQKQGSNQLFEMDPSTS